MLSLEDQAWLKSSHPDLYYNPQNNTIRGELAFKMFYSLSQKNEYVINPDKSFETVEGTIIEDVYEIEISLGTDRSIPSVREMGGRILASQKKWHIQNLIDLHVFLDGTLCLGIPIETDLRLPKGFNIKDFFERLLIPYFFYQSYFERYGKEPWAGYAHGDLGILESFQNQFGEGAAPLEIIRNYRAALTSKTQDMLIKRKKLKGHHKCWCGSAKKFRKCHRKAMFGYNNLEYVYRTNFPKSASSNRV